MPCVTYNNDLILFVEGYLLNIAGIGKSVTNLEIIIVQGFSVDAKQVNIVLNSHHHDDGIR